MEILLVSEEQFKKALEIFLDENYTPKVPKSDYLFYFGKLAIMSGLISKNWHLLADENNMINITAFYEQYSKMFEKTSNIAFQGFTFDKNDLNELIGYIKAQAPRGAAIENN